MVRIGSPWTRPPAMRIDETDDKLPLPLAKFPKVVKVLIVSLLKARVFLTTTEVAFGSPTTSPLASVMFRVAWKPGGHGA